MKIGENIFQLSLLFKSLSPIHSTQTDNFIWKMILSCLKFAEKQPLDFQYLLNNFKKFFFVKMTSTHSNRQQKLITKDSILYLLNFHKYLFNLNVPELLDINLNFIERKMICQVIFISHQYHCFMLCEMKFNLHWLFD